MLRKALKQEPAFLNKQARFGGHMSGLEETPSRLKTSWRDDVSADPGTPQYPPLRSWRRGLEADKQQTME